MLPKRKFNMVFTAVMFGLASMSLSAAEFTLTSPDIKPGEYMDKKQEFIGFGCTGENLPPALSWHNPPEGTKSYALTVYDPDAPTGSGWWHWQIVNIPKEVNELAVGANSETSKLAPIGSLQIENDYGQAGFGGTCPPKGHGDHRYQFTIHALKVERLDLNAKVSGALAGYMIKSNAIGSATIEALYRRD